MSFFTSIDPSNHTFVFPYAFKVTIKIPSLPTFLTWCSALTLTTHVFNTHNYPLSLTFTIHLKHINSINYFPTSPHNSHPNINLHSFLSFYEIQPNILQTHTHTFIFPYQCPYTHISSFSYYISYTFNTHISSIISHLGGPQLLPSCYSTTPVVYSFFPHFPFNNFPFQLLHLALPSLTHYPYTTSTWNGTSSPWYSATPPNNLNQFLQHSPIPPSIPRIGGLHPKTQGGKTQLSFWSSIITPTFLALMLLP